MIGRIGLLVLLLPGVCLAGTIRFEVGGVEPRPVMVLLPPDLDGRPVVSVRGGACAEERLRPALPRLRSLADGAVLDGIWPAPEAAFVELPVTREGDAVLLPLLVQPGGCRQMVTVAYARSGAAPPPEGHFLPRRVARTVVNPQDFARFYRERSRGATVDYLIVTRESFASKSESLEDFVAFKTAQGFSPLVVTVEALQEEMDDPDLAVPEVVRGWLQANYKALGIEYVLLVGSPNPDKEGTLPMKVCWPAKAWEDPEYGLFDVPTDIYYADLTGNWNPDGDAEWCELEDYMELPDDVPPNDGERLDGVDLTPEVLVGRVPHFGAQPDYGDKILQRLMAYQTSAPEPWHNRALLPSPMILFPDGSYVDGSEVAQFFIDNSLDPNGFRHTVLAERDGKLPCTDPGDSPLTAETVPEHWNQGYGAIFWCAHGNQDGAYRNVWDADWNENGLPEQEEAASPHFINTLFYKVGDPSRPPVVFQGSCMTADPSTDGNLTHTLLHTGSIGNVASTRITMGLGDDDAGWQPSPYSPGAFTLGVYFTHAALVARKPLGQAFHEALGTLAFGVQPWTLKTRLEFNLYGDPSLVLPGCDDDADCGDADLCNGTEYCAQGRCRKQPPAPCLPPEEPGPCRTFECVPQEGCVFVPRAEGAACDAGIACTQPGKCAAGQCAPGAPVVCPPAKELCWESLCDQAGNGCLTQPQPDGTVCDDAGVLGVCAQGTCVTSPAADIAAEPDGRADGAGAVTADTSGAGGGRGRGCAAAPSGAGWPLVLLLLWAGIVLDGLRSRARYWLGSPHGNGAVENESNEGATRT